MLVPLPQAWLRTDLELIYVASFGTGVNMMGAEALNVPVCLAWPRVLRPFPEERASQAATAPLAWALKHGVQPRPQVTSAESQPTHRPMIFKNLSF